MEEGAPARSALTRVTALPLSKRARASLPSIFTGMSKRGLVSLWAWSARWGTSDTALPMVTSRSLSGQAQAMWSTLPQT